MILSRFANFGTSLRFSIFLWPNESNGAIQEKVRTLRKSAFANREISPMRLHALHGLVSALFFLKSEARLRIKPQRAVAESKTHTWVCTTPCLLLCMMSIARKEPVVTRNRTSQSFRKKESLIFQFEL